MKRSEVLRELVPAVNRVARILNGEKPAELPIETLDSLKLHVNRSTAAAIGLTIPPLILVRADKIFE